MQVWPVLKKIAAHWRAAADETLEGGDVAIAYGPYPVLVDGRAGHADGTGEAQRAKEPGQLHARYGTSCPTHQEKSKKVDFSSV